MSYKPLQPKRWGHLFSHVHTLALAMVFTLLLCASTSASANDDGLTLVLTDGATGQSLVKQKVYGYLVNPNGTIASIPGSPFISNEAGVINLDELDADLKYYFKTVDAFQRWQRTEHLQAGQDPVAFRVGVRYAIDGAPGVLIDSPTPEAFTDAGLIAQDATTEPTPAIEPNEAVVTYTANAPSTPRFVQALNVAFATIRNAITGAPIEGVKVYAYQVNADGANQTVPGWPKTTDLGGRVSVLDLSNANSYYLKARVYNRKWTRTDIFTPTGGPVDFPIGSLEVALVDTSAHIPGDPVPYIRVNIEQHLGNDQFQTIHSIRADGQGIIRTDIAGLGVDNVEVRIRIEGESAIETITVDGDNVTSDLIVAPGNYAFATAGELPQEPPANYVALQTINRATFGMNIDLLAQVDGMNEAQALAWADAWILEQLEYPQGIAAPSEISFRDKIFSSDRTLPYYPGTPQVEGSLGAKVSFEETNPAWAPFQARLELLPEWREQNTTTEVLVPNDFELDRILLMYMIESPWQLREVMAQFWDNHFSTETSASGNRRLVEHNESSGFRIDTVITEGEPVEETPAYLAEKQIEYTNLANITKSLSSSGALGNFASLLNFSATNPSMVVYLNSADSTKQDPNENYAREVFELHCLGVDNGYSLGDIKEAARVFTGWNVMKGPQTKINPATGIVYQSTNYHNADFNFIPGRHSNGSGELVEYDQDGNPIPYNGDKYTLIRLNSDYQDGAPIEDYYVYGPIKLQEGNNGEDGVYEGLELLDRLSRMRETALFVSGKLVELFVSDEPLPDLQSRVADVFEANVDHPEQVKLLVYTILTSPEFRAVENFRIKIKTPLEDTTGLHRQLMPNVADMWTYKAPENGGNANGSNGEYAAPRSFLTNASMGLYEKVEPTGYPENGAEWLDTDGLLKRLNHHYDVAIKNYIGPWTAPEGISDEINKRAYRWMAETKGFTTEDEVIDYFLALLTNGVATHVERNEYHAALNHFRDFDLVSGTYKTTQDANIRLLISAILSSPQYLYQ